MIYNRHDSVNASCILGHSLLWPHSTNDKKLCKYMWTYSTDPIQTVYLYWLPMSIHEQIIKGYVSSEFDDACCSPFLVVNSLIGFHQ